MNGAKEDKAVDVMSKLSRMVGNQIFRMVLNRRLSEDEFRGDEDEDADGHEFKSIVVEMQHIKGLFMAGDYVPWLRPFDIGGIEKRMKALRKRWDAFLDIVLDEHEK